MQKTIVIAALAAVIIPQGMLSAQVRSEPLRAFAYSLGDPDRPRIGVSTRSSGKRDTLGLLVESVTSGGPAASAGIEEGDRLVSINGVNLRLSPEDAGEPDMDGITMRRLTRELAKHKPGDEVELRVYRDGQTRTVRLRTVDLDDLRPSVTTAEVFRSAGSDRAVLGISLGGTGSRRDTLGVLVVGVTDSGPAHLAGIEEGDRLAMINSVDLRVAREDAGDMQASQARMRRLTREMENVKAGDQVTLRVYSGGQTREVRATATRASELPRQSGAFYFGDMIGPVLDRVRVISPTIKRPSVLIRPRTIYDGAATRILDEVRLRAEAERGTRAARRADEARARAEARAGEVNRALESELRRLETDYLRSRRSAEARELEQRRLEAARLRRAG